MRLGQLARKLALKPSELVDVLSSKGISTESGINTRLESDQVQFIVKTLAPEKLAGIMAEPVVQEEPEVVVVEAKNIVEEVIVVAEPEPVIIMEEVPFITVEPELIEKKEVVANQEEATVIKAPKVELQGLKVLGKIELPEAKKKEPLIDVTLTATESSSELIADRNAPVKNTQATPRRNQPQQRRERTERNDRPVKNPITVKREQEALEAQQKRKEKAEKEKEKRTQNYLSRVKSAPTKAAKRIDEEQVIEEIEEEVRPAKTWIGKFFRWFKS